MHETDDLNRSCNQQDAYAAGGGQGAPAPAFGVSGEERAEGAAAAPITAAEQVPGGQEVRTSSASSTAPAESAADKDAAKKARRAAWAHAGVVVWTLVGIVVALILLGQVLNLFAIPVGILIWTGIIVFCLRDTVNALARRMSRGLAVGVAYVIMIAVVAGIVVLMSSPFFGIGDQFMDIATSAPQVAQNVQQMYADFSSAHPQIMQNPQVLQWIDQAQDSVVSWAQGFVATSLNSLVNLGSALVNSAICIGFALVVAFWTLLSEPDMGREVRRLVGPEHEDGARFFYLTFTRVVGGYIRGTLLQCGVIAAGCIVAFLILGVPNAVAFALITGILNIIPVVGPWLGGAAAGLAALSVGPWTALLSLLVTIAIQQVVYTFVSPKIMSDSVDVNPILVILSMMCGYAIGWQLSGLVGSLTGMLLSIPFAALLKALFVYYFEKKTGRQIVAEDGVFFKGVPSEEGATDPVADATSPHPLAARIKAQARRAADRVNEGARMQADGNRRSPR